MDFSNKQIIKNKLLPSELTELSKKIKKEGIALGFQQIGITGVDLSKDEIYLEKWLSLGRNGEMRYMSSHGKKRSRPSMIVPQTLKIISARMDYLTPESEESIKILKNKKKAFISRYALGRDYHKVLKGRLKKLVAFIEEQIRDYNFRIFVDSAPVLEKAIARNAGLGWIGKNTNLINPKAGSFFFLGEIYTDLDLPHDSQTSNHCGSCVACIDCCPTNAIVAPYQLDARKCISYLTIEHKSSIPIKYRKKIGNRIYGCDDCQLFCPWNKFADPSKITDFKVRHNLDRANLIDLFLWSKDEWEKNLRGSAMRRVGYEGWLRNLAIALGNSEKSNDLMLALIKRKNHPSSMVREHVEWALEQHN
ncbi:MAG: tRNA epoxyqueuosine(34) reductase QueG [Gammaproteobacteria bacterium TMED78]|nr:MAG: tRNA epoxyqueuosine(34) reductase QueG [Gammaproteobacteria bacterium TMED78]|tara:strand:+ start:38514 stop:39602 length:1089 start_codon:yes stop_codon:yes gene_type:complete